MFTCFAEVHMELSLSCATRRPEGGLSAHGASLQFEVVKGHQSTSYTTPAPLYHRAANGRPPMFAALCLPIPDVRTMAADIAECLPRLAARAIPPMFHLLAHTCKLSTLPDINRRST